MCTLLFHNVDISESTKRIDVYHTDIVKLYFNVSGYTFIQL